MKKIIAFTTIYPNMKQDGIFNPQSCKLSENLLVPNIMLKENFENNGFICHTADLVDPKSVAAYIFIEIPVDSIYTVKTPTQKIKYFLKAKWRRDILLQSVKQGQKCKRYLIVNEPPVVAPVSYDLHNHRFFDRIFTWSELIPSGKKVEKFRIPEVRPAERYFVPFSQRRFSTLIASNKSSTIEGEKYSARKEVIQYFEDRPGMLDLYGYGWESENFSSYCGTTDAKLSTLSGYKFCICYENMTGIKGYITEKIFDCFFANCVPIYWGADDVCSLIPEGTFIDRRKFQTMDDLLAFLQSIDEEEYMRYLSNIQNFLNSDGFKGSFDARFYADRLSGIILSDVKEKK